MLGYRVVEFHEVRLGDHHRISTLSKMGCILEFSGENIAGVDDVWDMADVYFAINDGFADLTFTEIDVFHSLVVREEDQETHASLSL